MKLESNNSFEERPSHEQRLLMLIGGVQKSGSYKTDYLGLERPMSIRLNALNYPKVKAISKLSGNSMNLVINDLIEVAYGVMQENLSDEDGQRLSDIANEISAGWLAEREDGGSK